HARVYSNHREGSACACGAARSKALRSDGWRSRAYRDVFTACFGRRRPTRSNSQTYTLLAAEYFVCKGIKSKTRLSSLGSTSTVGDLYTLGVVYSIFSAVPCGMAMYRSGSFCSSHLRTLGALL